MTRKLPRKSFRKFRVEERNYNDPAYKEFRKLVVKRDSRCCQWHGCGSSKRLCVHHIRTWAKYPELRFVVRNGITLCKEHHDLIWGKEEDYERLFTETVRQIQKDPAYARRNKKRAPKKKRNRKDFTARYLKEKAKKRK